MKKLLIWGYILPLILFAKTPQWFSTQNLAKTKTQIIGYGQSKDYNKAIQIAQKKIAEMLQLKVDSRLSIDKYSSTDSYTREINQTVLITSNVQLNNLSILKKERVGNRYFVAILYDNLALFLKIIQNTPLQTKSFKHPYLTKTSLFKELKNHLGFYPKSTIYSQNGQYYISVNNNQFLITQQDFIELFNNISSSYIDIKLKEILKENSSYFTTTRFKNSGFASLFLVSESGTVVTLFQNIKLKNRTITYPNKKEYDGLRAEIESRNKSQKDMFVALLCKKKEDLGLFNQISTNIEEESFRFGDLIDLMNRCAFSSRILTIFR